MNKEDREHIHSIVDAVIDGEDVEFYYATEWNNASDPSLRGLRGNPQDYRLAPKPIEISVYRSRAENGRYKKGEMVTCLHDFYKGNPFWDHVETFTHTVKEGKV